jgi:two-component system, OmpR family, sensor kinase
MIFHSIRWRLQIWHGLLLLVVLTGFGLTAWRVASDSVWNQIDAELERTLEAVFRPPINGDGAPPRPGPFPPTAENFRERLASAIHRQPSAVASRNSYVILWRSDGSVAAQSKGTPSGIVKPGPLHDARTYAADRRRGEFKELYRVLPFGDVVLIGRSVAPELSSLRTVGLSLIAAGLMIWLLGLAGGWWLTTHALRTVEVISATAEKIAAGDLSQRVQAANTDSELGRLANVLNSTFTRLETAFQQQARFTADASHELRTPISVVLAQTQSALARDRSAAEYRDALEACARAAQRMRKLVESLLQLARLDAEQEHTRRQPVDLAAIAEECVEFVRPMSDLRGIRITTDLQSAACMADPEQLVQVAINLFTNAVQFNKDSGLVRVSTGVQDGVASLVVSDTGEGIPEDDLPLIFDRFYRVDKSRSRANGRTGLGLAICRSIVESHQGKLTAVSQTGAGSIFTVGLPVLAGRPTASD